MELVSNPAGGQLNWFYGLGALALESTPGTFRWRSGLASGNYFSPKYYASGWRGGSRARITTRFVSGLGKTLGLTSSFLGVSLDLYGVNIYTDDPQSMNAVSPRKFSLNLGMTLYGALVSGGGFISAGYFAIDSFYPGGWQGALDNNADLQRRNEKVIPGFKLYQKY